MRHPTALGVFSSARALRQVLGGCALFHFALRTDHQTPFLPGVLAACVLVCAAPTSAARTAFRAKRTQDNVVPAYTVTDLGTISGSGGCCFFPTSISDNGHVVGRFSGASGGYRGFLWQDGVMADIGSLGGGVTQALGVNDAGVTVGLSLNSSGAERAFAGFDGEMVDLGTLGGAYSLARAVNDDGVIAGGSQRRRGRQRFQHAVLWAQGRIVDLGTLGGEFSEGLGLNNAGQVVGWAWDSARQTRAFLWTPGDGMIDLGDLGAPTAVAAAVNDNGQIVGVAEPAGEPFGIEHAFLWQEGVMTDLGVLPEAGSEGPFGPELVNTAAASINNAGQVVGNSYPGTPELPLRPGPFLWQDGVMSNLNDLVESGSGWTITGASDINDHGQIVGTARSASGDIRAVVLTPFAAPPQ